MYGALVSVIIPAYNSEKYISECLISVLSQDYKNIEIIVIDDCSIDGTESVVCNLINNNINIKYFKTTKNSGAGVSRNLGLSKAKGRYIAFLDADDIWHESKISKQINFLLKNKACISHTSYCMINEEGGRISGGVNVSNLVDLALYMKTTEIGLSTALIDRERVGEIYFDTARTRQDTMLWLRLFSLGFTSLGLNENLVSYRIRNGQISKNKFKMLYRTFIVYWSVNTIPSPIRIIYFLFYVFNGIKKRVHSKEFKL